MDIEKYIQTLDQEGLITLKRQIDSYLNVTQIPDVGINLKAFGQKLKQEKLASSRLINVIELLSIRVEFVHQVTKQLILSQRNSGLKTFIEFKKIRGY